MKFIGGTSIKCYLTGQTINLEKDDYAIDHIIPISKGGTNDLANLGITFYTINQMKSDMTVDELLEKCKQILEYHGYTISK